MFGKGGGGGCIMTKVVGSYIEQGMCIYIPNSKCVHRLVLQMQVFILSNNYGGFLIVLHVIVIPWARVLCLIYTHKHEGRRPKCECVSTGKAQVPVV